jgi:hypothetical protein
MVPKLQTKPSSLITTCRLDILSIGVLTFFVLISLGSLLSSSVNGSERYQIDRTPGQGRMWLSWTKPERQRFILGYLWAYHSGFSSGCVTYFENGSTQISANVEASPLQRCKLQELTYSKDVSYYESQITIYYEKYPTDFDVPLPQLLQAFSDTENRSASEIHAVWLGEHSHP